MVTRIQPHKQPKLIHVKLTYTHSYSTMCNVHTCRHMRNVHEHSLGCMTGALWDSCSVHRFHPSSRSIRCPNSPNCSCIPSFLQSRGSSCFQIAWYMHRSVHEIRITSSFICKDSLTKVFFGRHVRQLCKCLSYQDSFQMMKIKAVSKYIMLAF